MIAFFGCVLQAEGYMAKQPGDKMLNTHCLSREVRLRWGVAAVFIAKGHVVLKLRQ